MSVNNNKYCAVSFDYAGLYPRQMKSFNINPFRNIVRKNTIRKIFNL